MPQSFGTGSPAISLSPTFNHVARPAWLKHLPNAVLSLDLTALDLKDMTFFGLNALLAQGVPGGQTGQAPPWVNIVPLVLIMVVFYFILIRPQQKKAKEHEKLLKTLRPKDKVVTSGGVTGIIVAVQEKTVTIRSADTKLEVLKSAVSEITERAASEA
jgi:preprotein translocase subunit YajC